MPLYEYCCNSCGEFEVWRSLAEYNVPVNCPNCAQTAQKIFSAPNVNLNSGSLSALNRSESNEPRLVKQKPKVPTKPRYQTSNSKRPWMISHGPTRY